MIQLYEHAAVFCCPSVYEPFGIINLEAMACETAVVASRVGGIPEVVVPEETGLLVDLTLSPVPSSRPMRGVLGRAGGGDQPPGPGPRAAHQMGRRLQRVLEQFSWTPSPRPRSSFRTLR